MSINQNPEVINSQIASLKTYLGYRRELLGVLNNQPAIWYFQSWSEKTIKETIDRDLFESVKLEMLRSWFIDALTTILDNNPEQVLLDEQTRQWLLNILREAISRYMSENWNVDQHQIDKEPTLKVLTYVPWTYYWKDWFNAEINLPAGQKIKYFRAEYGNDEELTEEQKRYFESHSFTKEEYLEILISLRDYFNTLWAKLDESHNTIEELSNDKNFMILCRSLTGIPYLWKFHGYYIGDWNNKRIFIKSE